MKYILVDKICDVLGEVSKPVLLQADLFWSAVVPDAFDLLDECVLQDVVVEKIRLEFHAFELYHYIAGLTNIPKGIITIN